MTKKILLVIGVIAALSIGVGTKVHAFPLFRTGSSTTITSNQTVNSTTYLAGKDVDVSGTVNGDVFCFGQTVSISGDVNGDIMCFGQSITVSGPVDGSVRLVGQTVNINGQISRNASVAGQTIDSNAGSSIGQDASLAGQDIHLNGAVTRDLAVAGNNVNVNGKVGRDISATVHQLTLGSGANVGGSVNYSSNSKLIQVSGAQVAGQITHHLPKKTHNGPFHFFVFAGLAALIFAVVLIVCAVVLTALFPEPIHNTTTQAMKRPWTTLLAGFVATFAVPMAAIILSITLVGLPLAGLLVMSWLLISLTSGLFSAYYLGRRIWKGQHNAILRVLLGGVILLIVMLIPILGFIIALIVWWMGAGMVILQIGSHLQKPKYNLK